MKPIEIIYIYGRGHIGSTLLDRVLGCDPGNQSLGEIMHLDMYIKENSCSCRKKVILCDFWSKVLKKYKQECHDNKIKNLYDLSVESLKKKALWLLTSNLEIKNDPRIEEYNKKNFLLFKSIKEISKKKYLIDSSKNPLRLAYLANSDYFKIRVIHLFRDGRGTLNSRKRAAKRSLNVPYRGAAMETVRFILHERVLSRVLNKLDVCKKTGLRYNDFAGKFSESIKQLYSRLDMDYPEDVFENSENKLFYQKTINDLEHSHLIGGNRMRYKKVSKIAPSQKWEIELSNYEKAVFNICGGNRQNDKFNI